MKEYEVLEKRIGQLETIIKLLIGPKDLEKLELEVFRMGINGDCSWAYVSGAIDAISNAESFPELADCISRK